jgi:hypothetical protein
VPPGRPSDRGTAWLAASGNWLPDRLVRCGSIATKSSNSANELMSASRRNRSNSRGLQYVAKGQTRINASLDCLVSAANKGYRYRETECFGGLEIDHEL